ncbi:MAG: hypothetical protein OXR66_05290 [Candidatus Woesearchaeota archaeon]|nr:hypothetical protein [Candidatus Woesearchaeota archaeon]
MIAQVADFCIPHFFVKRAIPETLPKEMQEIVAQIKQLPKARRVRAAYDVLTKKYKGQKFQTYTRLWQLYETDVATLWKQHNFIHCTAMNYLLRVLLVKSGIPDEHIELRRTLVWYLSPHQYVRIQLTNEHVNVDVWGENNNIPYGQYATGFW